jgi:N4-gp56 family major capsid protein
MGFALRKPALENLRAALVFGNKSFAEMGRFEPGADVIKFATVPDLAVATTPLTEGSPPTAVALSVSATLLDSDQYGNLVDITDLAAVKSPLDLAALAGERLGRNAAETIDQLVRDVIAGGGTVMFSEVGATQRSDLDASGDEMTSAVLRKLKGKMFKGKIPPFADNYYRIIVTPEQAYDLQNETTAGSFIDVMKYTDPSDIIQGEIGRVAGFRVIQAVNAPTFSSSVTVHAAIAFGRLPGWGWGDLQALRTYYTAPGGKGDELHQKESVGWKVAFGTAVLANARYYRLETAATTTL